MIVAIIINVFTVTCSCIAAAALGSNPLAWFVGSVFIVLGMGIAGLMAMSQR